MKEVLKDKSCAIEGERYDFIGCVVPCEEDRDLSNCCAIANIYHLGCLVE